MKPALVPRWLFALGLVVGVGAATHLLAVWALPRVIMHRVMSLNLSGAPPTPYLPPMTDHTMRRVVMPSTDLLYTTCVWDVSKRPLRIRADPKSPHYWSIALYAANSDNFFVVNDRQAAGAPVDLVLVGPEAYGALAPLPASARIVTAPGTKGLLLMRVLVGDYAAERGTMEAARASLRCEVL